MSNYRRLISYIYAYEGGVKGKNIGYAKVEVRSGQCRIYVNVKKVYVGRNDIGVYLLAPAAEIFLGRIFIRGGSGEFRITVAADKVDGKETALDQCYGLTIHDAESSWQSYTTIWEDAVAQAAEIELAEVTAENVRKQNGEKDCGQTGAGVCFDKPYEFPVSREIERELEQEEIQLQATIPGNSSSQENGKTDECINESGNEEIKAETDKETNKETSGETDRESDGKAGKWIPETVLEAVPEAQEESLKPASENRAAQPKDSEEVSGQSALNTKEAEETAPDPEDPVKLAELDRQEQEQLRPNQFWNRMQQRYARVLAFDYDKGCEILSIKPQDIGLLPREIWVYGNNSFLLHGYYNYRHLILAKLDNPQGEPRYLLGVPGHYFSNEKYMATMFGFPHFVIARKQPDGDGRFGYWYTDIRL